MEGTNEGLDEGPEGTVDGCKEGIVDGTEVGDSVGQTPATSQEPRHADISQIRSPIDPNPFSPQAACAQSLVHDVAQLANSVTSEAKDSTSSWQPE